MHDRVVLVEHLLRRLTEPSATAARRARLKLLITRAFEDSDGTSGYRRVEAQPVRWGEPPARSWCGR
jgi:hypothetical protein